jgi:hypothetical protein
VSNLPATQSSAPIANRVQDIDGLEDVDARDISMPIIKINHTSEQGYPVFEDTSGNSLGAKIEVVPLGMVKQRVMWEPNRVAKPGEKVYPICRARDFHNGIPDPERFPWDRTPFTPEQADANGGMISCQECPLKEWETGHDGKRPACNEQHAWVVKRRTEDDDLIPGIVTFQSTGLKPSRTFFGSFVTESKSPYTQWVEIELEKKRQGNVNYGVPKFRRIGNTSIEVRNDCSVQWPGIREYLRAPRRSDSVDDGTNGTTTSAPSDNVNRGPATTGNAVVGGVGDRGTPAPAAPQDDQDDDYTPQPPQRAQRRAQPAQGATAADPVPDDQPVAPGKPGDDLPF